MKNMTSNKKYKYILFDWDGTLAKTLDVWFYAEKDHLKQYGIEIDDRDLIKSFGDWEFGKKLGIKDNDKFIKELVEDVDQRLKSVELYEDVFKLLEIVRSNKLKTAIVTTAKSESIYPALDKYGLNRYFDIILTAEDVSKHKPDPEIIEKAVEMLDAAKEEALIIGDGPKDVLAGKASGITTVSFYPKDNERYYSEADIKSFNSDYVIHSLLDLVKIIN